MCILLPCNKKREFYDYGEENFLSLQTVLRQGRLPEHRRVLPLEGVVPGLLGGAEETVC